MASSRLLHAAIVVALALAVADADVAGVFKATHSNDVRHVGDAKVSVLRRNAETNADCPIKTECDCEDYEGGLDLW